MFLFSKPSNAQISEFISSQANSDFSYKRVGASVDGGIPPGFNVDHHRIRLGHGEKAWHKAVEAVQRWRMFEMPWLQLCWPDAPIAIGTTVAILISHYGFWSLNASRIVRIIQQSGTTSRYGFAYGTLLEHSESGEERFTIEWQQHDNSVWYDVLAFSRPRAMLARLGFPLSRRLQRRFMTSSKRAMAEAQT
ncbi:MAG: DUF1990 domain-containing protein [Acidobacteriales bacterium]|nr:DUF1990 domain-containing protein [Terriglobales bacterium]